MHPLTNMVLNTTSKLTSLSRWWIIAQIGTAAPLAAICVAARMMTMTAPSPDMFGAVLAAIIMFIVFFGAIVFFTAVPVAVVILVPYVVFGRLHD